MTSRNDRFKQALSRLDPSGDPAGAIKRGLHIEEPDQSFADRTLARLELRPGSSHLLVGPTGTGKTTQLRILERKLLKCKDIVPLFVDAMAEDVDLDHPRSLIVHLSPQIKRILVNEMAGTDNASRLFWATVYTRATSNTDPAEILQQIATIKRKVVLILDSFNHHQITRFAALCTDDLASLKQHMAVVVVGPPALTYGTGRELAECFDYFSVQPVYDPALGGTMQAFFMRLLGQRVEAEMLPSECCARLVDASGGVPRDLLALAQFALEESYVAGYNCVEPDDVTRAIDKFGQKHIAGLDTNDRARLHRLHKTGAFAPTGSRDIDLLVTRRILQYTAPSGARTFAVHPALVL